MYCQESSFYLYFKAVIFVTVLVALALTLLNCAGIGCTNHSSTYVEKG